MGATGDFHEILDADARRRAEDARKAPPKPVDMSEHSMSWDVRFRLVNTFPRETRPLFESLRTTLIPYGYTISPLHPAHDLSRPRMQTELARIAPDDPARYAPLVFELESSSAVLRVYVRQFGGRAAPDFAESRLDIANGCDLPTLEVILKDYITCMLQTPIPAAA